MDLNNDNTQLKQQDQPKPTASRVDDDDNLEEKDLERSYLFGQPEEKHTDAPGMESRGMGGQNFGKNNLTPSGDDKDNPSRNAGYSNDYFKRTEPLEEHPENSNFKSGAQAGEPAYDGTAPDEKQDEQNKGDDPATNNENRYQEGTVDNDKSSDDQLNIPGPNESPDQQKVGE